MEGIREILDNAEAAQPIAEVSGVKIASYEDAVALATADQINNAHLPSVEFNPDGSVAATPVKYAAVNMDIWYSNAYRVVDGEYQVVSGIKDYESIKGLKSGRVPAPHVQADVIVADKNGKPKYKTTVTVSDTDFIAEFTNTFSRDDMAKILPLLLEGAEREPVAEKNIFK